MSRQQLQGGKREKRRSSTGGVAKSHGHAVSTRAQEPASLQLDRIIHERLRLGILSALAVNTSLTFSDLKKLLNTSDGNLSVHARKLEEAEYISCEKTFAGRVPKTEYRMTGGGRRGPLRELDRMESTLRH